MKKYGIKFEKLVKARDPEVYISKEQIEQLVQMAERPDVSGLVVYLEKR